MTETTTLTVTGDGLPAAELESLLRPLADEDGVQLDFTGGETRNLDPAVTVGILQMVTALSVPFLAKLADRVFQSAPKATLHATGPDGTPVEVTAADEPSERVAKITVVIKNPNPNITIVVA